MNDIQDEMRITISEIQSIEIVSSKSEVDIIPDLMRIEEDSFEVGIRYTLDGLRTFLAKCRSFKATINRRIVAYIAINEYKISSVTHILSLAVLSQYRRKGVGSYLVNMIVNMTKVQSLNSKIILECRPRLENFYKSLGFETYDTKLAFYSIFNQDNKKIMAPALKMHFTGIKFGRQLSSNFSFNNNSAEAHDENCILYQNLLIDFLTSLKLCLSALNNILFSFKKKNSFEIIEAELLTIEIISSPKAERILQAIIHNALITRGLLNRGTTDSGLLVLNLINREKFLPLKYLICDNIHVAHDQELNYIHLIEFTEFTFESINKTYCYFSF